MGELVKVVATIEARMTSSRLPGKVLKDLSGKPMLQWIIERVMPSKNIDEIAIATSDKSSDDPIVELSRRVNVPCCRGNLEDVLERLTMCAESRNADLIVRLTGDNPLCHYGLIDSMVECFLNSDYDFLCTTFMAFSKVWNVPRTFPLGLGVAIFPLAILKDVNRLAVDPNERENTVKYIIDRPDKYRLGAFKAEGKFAKLNRPELRLTVDTEEDFEIMEQVFNSLSKEDIYFSVDESIEFLDNNPEIRDANSDVKQKWLCE